METRKAVLASVANLLIHNYTGTEALVSYQLSVGGASALKKAKKNSVLLQCSISLTTPTFYAVYGSASLLLSK